MATYVKMERPTSPVPSSPPPVAHSPPPVPSPNTGTELCSGFLSLDKMFGKETYWCELLRNRQFHIYKNEVSAQNNEPTEIIDCFMDVGTCVTETKNGFKIITGNPQLGPLSRRVWKFVVPKPEDKKEWVTAVQNVITISQQIIGEAKRHHLWGNLENSTKTKAQLSDLSLTWSREETTKRKKSDKAAKQARKERKKADQLLLLYTKILNHSLSPEEFKELDSERVYEYLPIFLQCPQLIDVLHDRLMAEPKLQHFAYWSKRAGLAVSNVYLHNTNFFGDTTLCETSYDFWSALGARFPLQKGEKITNLNIPDPLWGKGTIQELEVVKIFMSGHNPCLLKAKYTDPTIEDTHIFMKTDDCRSDLCVMTVFNIFTVLCETSGLSVKPEIIKFRIVAGENFGLMEFVENSVPLRDFDIELILQCSEEEIDTFLATAAGGYLGGFLLGIRDRHEDNLMIKDNNKFYQLDFKHAFNVKTFGIDGCRFAIPSRFKQTLDKLGKWENFKDRILAMFMVLRRNAPLIIHLCGILFRNQFPNSMIEEELLHSFYLDRTEEEALRRVSVLVDSGVVSIKRIMKNLTHEYSPNLKDSSGSTGSGIGAFFK
eukprot:TRINITY_DN9226_c0_g1_i1.p1 TRINITY_DN9226_c0_g1~~TRINITY_DN9226_c0_g1_i1.p1  ORF type:complete len:600 (-),score=115.15 TRINITY_DN9226_c0_g1_i1:37-1836(-)